MSSPTREPARGPARERRGAHRPPGLGVAGAVPWLVAAVAVVAVVAWATGWWGPGGDPASSSNTVSAGPSSSSTRSATTRATGSGSTTASPTATADRTVAVSVLNSTSRAGLAKTAASTLRTAGWTIRSTGNSSSGGPTTVYYGRSGLAATARAVADDLGAPAAVKESADFGASRVTVVLGTDFPG